MNIGILPDPVDSRDWGQLVECAKRGGSSEYELLAKIGAGHTVIWDTGTGALALDLTVDDACVAWLGVGEMVGLLGQEDAIAAFAKNAGCKALRLEGRKGWIRKFKHWRVTEMLDGIVCMERKL